MTVEEVINNIEEIKGIITDAVPCYDPNDSLDRYMAILNKATAALKKQILKKPIYEKLKSGDEYWYCPSCDEVVLTKLVNEPILNEYNHNHCGGCGQAIDWSDTNDKQ